MRDGVGKSHAGREESQEIEEELQTYTGSMRYGPLIRFHS